MSPTQTAIESGQPLISGELSLLTDYFIEGIRFDLYGRLTRDGYSVEEMTLHGTRVNLFPLLTEAQTKDAQDFCDDCLPKFGQARRDVAEETRDAERRAA